MGKIKEILDKIRKISAERDELKLQIEDKQQEINDLLIEKAKFEYGFDLEDEVLIQEVRGRITGFNVSYDRVEPVVHKYKKDGRLSKHTIWVYDMTYLKHFISENAT